MPRDLSQPHVAVSAVSPGTAVLCALLLSGLIQTRIRGARREAMTALALDVLELTRVRNGGTVAHVLADAMSAPGIGAASPEARIAALELTPVEHRPPRRSKRTAHAEFIGAAKGAQLLADAALAGSALTRAEDLCAVRSLCATLGAQLRNAPAAARAELTALCGGRLPESARG